MFKCSYMTCRLADELVVESGNREVDASVTVQFHIFLILANPDLPSAAINLLSEGKGRNNGYSK